MHKVMKILAFISSSLQFYSLYGLDKYMYGKMHAFKYSQYIMLFPILRTVAKLAIKIAKKPLLCSF